MRATRLRYNPSGSVLSAAVRALPALEHPVEVVVPVADVVAFLARQLGRVLAVGTTAGFCSHEQAHEESHQQDLHLHLFSRYRATGGIAYRGLSIISYFVLKSNT